MADWTQNSYYCVDNSDEEEESIVSPSELQKANIKYDKLLKYTVQLRNKLEKELQLKNDLSSLIEDVDMNIPEMVAKSLIAKALDD
tara:strand:- start:4243 stop:4500 length:258 start_codon:yes stop_codon:yes gene_type:complete